MTSCPRDVCGVGGVGGVGLEIKLIFFSFDEALVLDQTAVNSCVLNFLHRTASSLPYFPLCWSRQGLGLATVSE